MSYSEGERRYLTSAQIKQSGKWVTTGAPTRPYQLAFPLFLTEAAQAAKGDAVIQFVLDQNNNEAPYAIQVFKEMKEGQRHELWKRLGGITFVHRGQEPGLQVADLYTHLWYAYLEHGAAGMGTERYEAWQPLKKRKDWMKIADEQFLEPLLSTLKPAQRTSLEA